MSFNDRDYTREAIIKQLGLMELHGKDGSAVESGCQCIETKHTYFLEGLAEEGAGFGVSEKERAFYLGVSNLSRELRKRIEAEDFSLNGLVGNPHSVSCLAKQERCIEKLKVACAGDKCNPWAVCKASIPCA